MFILIFFSLLFFVPGLVMLLFPAFLWELRVGWMVEGDSEPSDLFLMQTRFGGVVIIGVGLYILIRGIYLA
ncbi:DUF6199 family natural product biosynthesis protein [Paenibacillus ginsengarvi]|uniref:DUF6199 domain-containing protein n=1 Tax=Paenibacillus ginsengarvi TaxID=400777 RepID=A0A3B0BR82_9BACL|nr:DUF6199 family natural product biosynthesis protein [Paenibacillus ginsengarvi]RKN75815.1 hypothetical protein D7M11_25250 [Paenibacillus ginsengarvi]